MSGTQKCAVGLERWHALQLGESRKVALRRTGSGSALSRGQGFNGDIFERRANWSGPVKFNITFCQSKSL